MNTILPLDRFPLTNSIRVTDVIIGYAGITPVQITAGSLFDTIPDDGISTKNIVDSQITEPLIYKSSVSERILQDGSIGSNSISPLSIHSEHIKSNAVTPDKIKDLSLPASKFTYREGSSDKILSAIHFPENSITSRTIKSRTIQTNHLTTTAPTGTDVDTRIDGYNIAQSTLQGNHLSFLTEDVSTFLQIDVRGFTDFFRDSSREFVYIHLIANIVDSTENNIIVEGKDNRLFLNTQENPSSLFFAESLFVSADTNCDSEFLVRFPKYPVGTTLQFRIITEYPDIGTNMAYSLLWETTLHGTRNRERVYPRRVTNTSSVQWSPQPVSVVAQELFETNYIRIDFVSPR